MVWSERPEHGHDSVEHRKRKHESGGIARLEKADIAPDQAPDEMHRSVDRIELETEREAVRVGVEAVIGVGQEQDSALGEKIEAQPRRQDDQRGRLGFLTESDRL